MRRWSFAKLGQSIDDNRITVCLVISAIGLVFLQDLVGSLFSGEQKWYSALASVIFIAVLIYCVWIGAKGPALIERSNRLLRAKVEQQDELINSFGSDYFAIWDYWLAILAGEVGLGGDDRISVYRFEGNSFTMIGRYAERPDLDRPGRSIYPSDQGIIGHAWKDGDGKACAQDLPNPETDLDGYCAVNKENWNIPLGVTRKMNMKPRSVAAFAITKPKDKIRNGVIVFESTRGDRFDEAALERHVRGAMGKQMSHLIEVLADREPSLSYAKTKGF
jgi:hypothetical protein